MSSMIQCDGCKNLMFADSRSPKDAWREVWIDRNWRYHLCKMCYENFMRNIMHQKWCEDEGQWVDESYEGYKDDD